MDGDRLLIYVLRRDLRVSDNPIIHHLATSEDHGFTHLLPVYVLPSEQIEVSGFVAEGQESPYPPALSSVGRFWRCGPHRARFLAQSIWDLKQSLEDLGSNLVIRAGSLGRVLEHILSEIEDVGAVWMTEEKSSEEQKEQDAVAAACSQSGVEFKLWQDEKYFVDDRDTGLENPSDLPDVFTTYRKLQEPLRDRPRSVLPRPNRASLPKFPDEDLIPQPNHPFVEATSFEDLEARLLAPLRDIFPKAPPYPENGASAHPFKGGETAALERLASIVCSGAVAAYKDTRNGLLGTDFSTKLSAFLALGCVSARQVHKELLDFENGSNERYKSSEGYGKGENEGAQAVRLELLWRDYMRLCTVKFGRRLFRLSGFRHTEKEWITPDPSAAPPEQELPAEEVKRIIDRFLAGTTGMGLIDASQRELYHTGYTSNRARQNVASFLAKHLDIDWRYGAEWYEMMLVDYDVSSNWSNWQYVAGVGNDPRGEARIFNPVKQAFDYDKDGEYVRMWVPEVSGLEKLENVFQPSTASKEDLEQCGLLDNIMVTDPVKRIEFTVDKKPKTSRRTIPRRRGTGRGGRGGAEGSAESGGDASSVGSGARGVRQQGGMRAGGAGNRQRNQPTAPPPPPPAATLPPHPQVATAMHPVPFAAVPVMTPGGVYPQQYAAPQWFAHPSYPPSPGWVYAPAPADMAGRVVPQYSQQGGGVQQQPPYAPYIPGPPYYDPHNMGPPS